MSNIQVFGIPGSPCLRTVEAVLIEKGAKYQLHRMGPGEQKAPDYVKQRHAFGRVPAFEHDGFRLYETQAIIRYLDDVYSEPSLVPADIQARARMNQVIGIVEWYFFPKVVGPIGFNRVVGPRLFSLPADEAAVVEAMPMGRTCFAELDRLLGQKPYFTGDDVSLADFMLAPGIDLLGECAEGKELIGGTHIGGWLERMTVRPSFVATQPPAALRQAA